MVFKIVQRLESEWVGDELLDTTEHTVGLVADEFLAQEFCNKYPCCYYHEVHLIKYTNELRANLVYEDSDLETRVIPIIKPEY